MDWDQLRRDLTKTEQKYLERTQKKLRYCIYCQPYDGGEPVWIFGEQIDLEDLYDDIRVPERYRDIITDHLRCPFCGRDGFERTETVGLEDRYDAEVSHHIKVAERKFGKDIDALQRHLELYPVLALAHPLGRKLYKEIIRHAVPRCKISGDFWRARKVTGEGVLDTQEMYAPPVGSTREGRYHHAGQSVLYLANSQQDAIREVLDTPSKALVWVQEYSVQEIDMILDLSGGWEALGPSTNTLIVAFLTKRVLQQKAENPVTTWKPQYHITRFIADCARVARFKGIRYPSTRGYGENAVFFEPQDLPIAPKGVPQVLIYEPKDVTSLPV